jgi:hypothetical protein
VNTIEAIEHRRGHRRRAVLRTITVVFAVAAAFIGGVALGEASHDAPQAGGSQTILRTLVPLSLVPVAGGPSQTVTVTTTAP